MSEETKPKCEHGEDQVTVKVNGVNVTARGRAALIIAAGIVIATYML